MTADIQQAQQEVVDDFARFTDWEERYGHIIELGKQHPDIPAEFMVEKFRVKGCQSTVYLHAALEDGRVRMQATSDAMIVRGLIAILMRLYDNRTPDEILAHEPDFLQKLGLTQNLTIGRQNGLRAMIEQIRLYALAFQAMARANLSRN